MSIWTKVAKACTLMEAGGLPLLARETRAFMRGELPGGPEPTRNRRLLDFTYVSRYGAMPAAAAPDFERTHDPARLVINWLVPSFDIGSGGHMTIFRMIKNLEALGHENRIYILFGNPAVHDAKAIKRTIDEHFVKLEAPVLLDMEHMRDSDVVMATSWPTAYPVRQVTNTLRKAYFVQDFEPDFYAKGAEWFFAEATYRFGYYHLTAGPWLAGLLRRDYAAEADPFELSWERGLYQPRSGPRKPGKFRVLFYARPVTPRRCFELGMLALAQFHERFGDQVEIVTIGGDLAGYEPLFPFQDLGVVAMSAMPALYDTIDLALVHSSTNCSLLPLELMASGVPVIDLDVPNVVGTLADGQNARLVPATPWDLAEALAELFCDDAARQALAERGLRHALAHPSWEDAARVVEQGLLAQLARRRVPA